MSDLYRLADTEVESQLDGAELRWVIPVTIDYEAAAKAITVSKRVARLAVDAALAMGDTDDDDNYWDRVCRGVAYRGDDDVAAGHPC